MNKTTADTEEVKESCCSDACDAVDVEKVLKSDYDAVVAERDALVAEKDKVQAQLEALAKRYDKLFNSYAKLFDTYLAE